MGCVRTVSYSVVLNGWLGEVFSPTRGLRRGDPLSPFLFLLCREGLSSLFRLAQGDGLFSGVCLGCGGPRLTHLLFVDDYMIFGPATHECASQVKLVLGEYGRCFGQVVNFDKSISYFSPNVPTLI